MECRVEGVDLPGVLASRHLVVPDVSSLMTQPCTVFARNRIQRRDPARRHNHARVQERVEVMTMH